MTRYAARKFRAVAIHEAAHCVLAYLVDIPFVMVEVFTNIHPTPPGGAILGEVTFNRCWPEYAFGERKEFDKARAFNYAARDICMTMAGDLAAGLYTGRMPREFRGDDDGDDEDCIQTIGELLNITPAALRDFVARMYVITLEILHIPAVWAAVQAVADELFLQECLTWDEVCPLIDKAMGAYSNQPASGTGSRCARDIQRLSPRLAKGRRTGVC